MSSTSGFFLSSSMNAGNSSGCICSATSMSPLNCLLPTLPNVLFIKSTPIDFSNACSVGVISSI